MKERLSKVSSSLLRPLKGLNLSRPAAPSFEGCLDLTTMPVAPSRARTHYVNAIVSRLDATSEPIPSPYLDGDWPALQAEYLEQLATRPTPFLIDFIAHERFLPAMIALVHDRILASKALRVLINAITSSHAPPEIAQKLLQAELVPVLQELFSPDDSLLDALLHAAELLSLVTMLSADRQHRVDAFLVEQLQLEKAVAYAFGRTRSLYDDLIDPENDFGRYHSRSVEALDPDDIETRKFNWERSPRIVAKTLEFLSKSVLFLHVTATTDVLRRIMTTRSRFEDPSRLVTQAMQCLSENGGVLPALPICTTGMYLSDTLAVITRLDTFFAYDHDLPRRHYPSHNFYESCEALWRFQCDCIDYVLSCDDAEGSYVEGMVKWVTRDPRTIPNILRGRNRFHPDSEIDTGRLSSFIASVLSTTLSILSCMANISRIRPLHTSVVAKLCAFYMYISELGNDTYGRDVRQIGYEALLSSSVTPGHLDTVCVHVTPTLVEAIVTTLINQHYHHGYPLPMETSLLQQRAQSTAEDALARGNKQFQDDNFAAAVTSFTGAMHLFDHVEGNNVNNYALALAHRSKCFIRQKMFEHAYVDASRSLELRPDDYQYKRQFKLLKRRCENMH